MVATILSHSEVEVKLTQNIAALILAHDTYFVNRPSALRPSALTSIRIGHLGKSPVTLRVVGPFVEALNPRGQHLWAVRANIPFDQLLALVDQAYCAKQRGDLRPETREIVALSVAEAEKQLPGDGWLLVWSHAPQPATYWRVFRFVRGLVVA